MALFIDFNFINIRDLVDLSEVDAELENQLQNIVEQVFENQIENLSSENDGTARSAIKFISDVFTEVSPAIKSDVEIFVQTEPTQRMDEDTNRVPSKQLTATAKTTINKNDAYINYINNKFEQNQARYFINVLLNPVQTHLKNRFDYADIRNSYINAEMLGKDKDSAEKSDDMRRRQNEVSYTAEQQRRREYLKQTVLKQISEKQIRQRFERV